MKISKINTEWAQNYSNCGNMTVKVTFGNLKLINSHLRKIQQ